MRKILPLILALLVPITAQAGEWTFTAYNPDTGEAVELLKPQFYARCNEAVYAAKMAALGVIWTAEEVRYGER